MRCKPTSDGLTRYTAALRLVEQIDEHLERGTRHYHRKDGQLLTELDEVINAILSDQLAIGETKCPTKIASSTPYTRP